MALSAISVLALAGPVVTSAQGAAATVTCKDGSTDQAGRGACRGHGGVDKSAKAKAATATPAATTKSKRSKAAAAPTAASAAAAPAAGAGPLVTCKDGTQDQGGRGACRGHGGVDKSGAAAAPKATKAATAAAATPAAGAGAMVTCKDGTQDQGGRGACRGHGGVDKSGGAAAPNAAAKAAAPAAAVAAPSAAVAASPAAAAPAAPQAARPAATGAASPTTGNSVNTNPVGATARCKDGTYSHSASHTGTCSRHGGVAEWLKQ
jgi:hypothetical protein